MFSICVGDMEALLRLGRYCYTTTCTRPTVLFELQIEHYRQLLDNKQGQKFVEALLRRLHLRLSSRLARQSLSLPVFSRLLARVEEMTQRLDQRDYMVNVVFCWLHARLMECPTRLVGG